MAEKLWCYVDETGKICDISPCELSADEISYRLPKQLTLIDEMPKDGHYVWDFSKGQWSEVERIKQRKTLARKQYLAATDWYAARAVDEANSYPEEIRSKRITARREINDMETCKTVTALKKFTDDVV